MAKRVMCEGKLGPYEVLADKGNGEYERRMTEEQPCPEEAQNLARSMHEVRNKPKSKTDMSTRWELTEEHAYCGMHFTPGEMVHLDGSITQHASMHISEMGKKP